MPSEVADIPASNIENVTPDEITVDLPSSDIPNNNDKTYVEKIKIVGNVKTVTIEVVENPGDTFSPLLDENNLPKEFPVDDDGYIQLDELLNIDKIKIIVKEKDDDNVTGPDLDAIFHACIPGMFCCHNYFCSFVVH